MKAARLPSGARQGWGRRALFLCPDAKERRVVWEICLSDARLTQLLQPLIEELGYEFVGLDHHSNPKNPVLVIYIDQPGGIAVEDCERVSREDGRSMPRRTGGASSRGRSWARKTGRSGWIRTVRKWNWKWAISPKQGWCPITTAYF